MTVIRAFMRDGERWLEALKEQGADCEVDIGMTVGSDEVFVASAKFDPTFLRELADRQLGLVYTAYPSSD